ncbi:MAG: hypothetical protein ACLPTJ_15655 [Solirubrobacteraceae bacterium]
MVADRGYRRWAGAMLHGKPHCDRGAQYAFDKLGWLQFEQLAAELLELEAERRPDDCSPATEEPTLRALDCIARLAPGTARSRRRSRASCGAVRSSVGTRRCSDRHGDISELVPLRLCSSVWDIDVDIPRRYPSTR